MRKIPSKAITGFFYLSAFLIPVLGLLLILMARGFYPFKDNTLFIMDMHEQFMNFYASLRYTFQGDNSIFYSWSRSLGGNYIGLYAYYLDPLCWLTIFFPIDKLYAGILLLTLLRVGLSGLTFSAFLSHLWEKHHHIAEKDPNAPQSRMWFRFILLPLAVCYALNSYNMTYSLSPMWMNGVILLPLVLLGVEYLLEGKRGGVYLLALTSSFLFNYYTGYMVGLFTALYLVFRLAALLSRQTIKYYAGVALRFTVTTLFAIGISAPLLLPTIKDLASGKLTSNQYQPDSIAYFPLRALLGQLKNGTYHSITGDGMPLIYCGYLILPLVLLFFLSRRLNLREKLGALVVSVILICSFYFAALNYIWHGFLEPTGFPYRYSFVFIFFMLYLAARSLCALPIDRLPSVWQRKPVFEALFVLFLGIVSIDMGLNGYFIIYALEDQYDYDTISYYHAGLERIQPLVEQIQAADDGFYRINQNYEYSKNDAMLLGYNGMSHYSSTFNQSVNSLTQKLGMAQASIWNSGYGSTPLTDSLLSVKYTLSNSSVPDFYSKWGEAPCGTASYYNQYALPIAYSAPLASEIDLSLADPFENQNSLLNAIAATDNAYFSSVKFEKTNPSGEDLCWSYSFTADSAEPLYLYMRSEDFSNTHVYVNKAYVGNYFSNETKCILYLGSFCEGEPVLVEVVPDTAVKPVYESIKKLHTDMLQDTLRTLQTNGIQVTSHSRGAIEGTVFIPEGQKLLTSIPYDAGWTIKIDNKKVPAEKYADTFIAVEAESGSHTVSFSYVSPGFHTGLALLLVTLILCGLYFKFTKPPVPRY